MNMAMSLVDIIKKSERAFFLRYRHQMMYYGVMVDGILYEFPIPLEDIGDATLHNSEKSIMVMRYIRRAIADRTYVKAYLPEAPDQKGGNVDETA